VLEIPPLAALCIPAILVLIWAFIFLDSFMIYDWTPGIETFGDPVFFLGMKYGIYPF